MSSVSSLSGSGSSLYQFISSLSSGSAATGTTATATAGASTATTGSATAATSTTGATRGHHHHGKSDFFQKIQSAVTDALKSAGSDSSKDANSIVTDAISKVLGQSGGPNGSPPAGGGPDGPPPGDATAGSSTGNSSAGNSSATDSARSAFFATLKSFGVDAAQFHSDFTAAVKAAQSGDSSASASALSSLPTGVSIDTTA